ncbi:efflux RND transporter periplasmic adaptor subunit [Geothrix sp. PMB-07]|uniref:efflux RND transporter periplasmic adaptor subunit n=1 Tax=Geothrix sp. PMB-07 TaxID=3068640 RepID=UPI002740561C|nr:efflux RND transporter periplasmic adaptor subunit [Geothrix sp. PMB-07]WLT30528.1 efflux RND transporter periplasmic adaptor subunit [Geothrix sp. PMB-07]
MKAIGVLLPITLIFLSGCGKTDSTAPAPVPVQVRQPAVTNQPDSVNVSGSLLPENGLVMVSFLVPGRVLSVAHREGDFVRKGAVLAVLDSISLKAAADAAAAQAAAAQVAADRADDEWHRMQQLYESSSLAPNDYQKFKAGREATQEQLRQAQAAQAAARKNLTETTLVAPVDGYISRRLIEPGAMAGAGQPVFELGALDRLEVSVGVPEADIPQVRVGQKALVRIPTLPGRSFEGVTKVVGVSADPGTRTYLVRVGVPNPEHVLRLGMVAEVSILGDKAREVVTIPVEAVVRDTRGVTQVYQYFPDKKRVFARRVELGATSGTEVTVKSGLAKSDWLVTAGQERLWEGAAVEPATTPAAAGRR